MLVLGSTGGIVAGKKRGDDKLSKKIRINDIRLTENFKLYEFESKDTKEVKLHPSLVVKLQVMRNILCKPIKINSGYRTPEHNKKIGGHPRSQHMRGEAVDVSLWQQDETVILQLAKHVRFRRIKQYPKRRKFIHLGL